MRHPGQISIVIPVYNSADILPQLVARLDSWLENYVEAFEVILVNDGSRDESWGVICHLVDQYPWVRGINLMRNYGQHNALLCGIRAAKYELIITMDDDLQHPPEEIPKLLDRLANGYDVVYGTPHQEQHNIWRNMASRLTKLAFKSAMGVENARNVSAFRAFRTEIRKAFSDYSGPFASIDVLLTWGTTRFSSVKVEHAPRLMGESNYTFQKLLVHALNMMTGFSVLPLRLASLMGLGFAAFGGLVLVYVLVVYLIAGRVVQGFAFTTSIIAIFSGAQLLTLGIIGEYLARMHFRLMQKPSYVVQEQLN
jgi:undecaprenyl-phosphate 4-deoxy-4-formamido-L-arabinose transferase